MHPDDKITFTAEKAMWDKEMLKKYVKDDGEWVIYDESTSDAKKWDFPAAWSMTSDCPKDSYNISDEMLEEVIDNIKVLLHAAIDVKIDLNELKEIVREGFFSALEKEEKPSVKVLHF